VDQSQAGIPEAVLWPLAIVESFDHATEHNERLTVEDAMLVIKSCLDDEKQCNELDADLPGLLIPAGNRAGDRGDTRSNSWRATISSLRWRIKRGC
jgi:hypothetical protein